MAQYSDKQIEEYLKKKKKREEKRTRRRSVTVDQKNRQRLSVVFALIMIVMVYLIFKDAWWQVVRADDLQVKATEMQTVDTSLDPVRGNIYDSNMKALAQTVTEYQLYGYTNELYRADGISQSEKKENVRKLAEITGKDQADIEKALKGKENPVLLADGLKQSQIKKANKEFGNSIVVKTKVTRSYPNGAFAAQLLGGVNSDNNGLMGLEYEYNSTLSGVKGRVIRNTDSQGNPLATSSSKYYATKDGDSLVTSIDEVIQHYVEDALAQGMKDTEAESISCIVMNPRTGDILAMASTPNYNPNDPYRPSSDDDYNSFKNLSTKEQSDYLSRMWTNSIVSGVYEPGSTFKLITASAALDTGSATMNSRYYCDGAINVDGTMLHCWNNSHHGLQDIKEAVGNSCNPALAKVALDLGAVKLYRYIDLFGFNQKTNVDLPGEGTAIIKNTKNMNNVDLATTGYGQGIAVTPLQLLTAVNSLGNDGVLMKPKVVQKIVDKKGKTVKNFPDVAVRQVIAKETDDQMRDIMEYYVSDADGTSAYIPGYRVGGKTGTANIPENGGYSEDSVTSFVAMAPMDDPQISVLVLVRKPSKGEFGATTAGPIVKNILEKTLVYKGVERKYNSREEAALSKSEVTVPDVTNTDSQEALKKIQAAGLNVKSVPAGQEKTSFSVVDQYPKAGTKAVKGTTVYLYSK